ncbi:MAG: magnesium transporter [Chloroflexota bacterium]
MEIPDRDIAREETIQQIKDNLIKGEYGIAAQLFLDFHTGDQVEIFNVLNEVEQSKLLSNLDVLATAKLFSHQDDDETLQAAEALSLEKLADVLDEMEPDEAADLLGDLPPMLAADAIEQMEESDDVLPLLIYPDETAGGRMTTDFITIQQKNTVKEAIDQLRAHSPYNEVSYYVYVTNEKKKLVGICGLRELVISPENTSLKSIMNQEVIHINTWLDQEEVAQVMITYDLSSLPVTNNENQLVGIITHDDILDVVQEEATEDIYRLANVSDFEIEPNSPVKDQLKGRLPWLFLNTFTALFASWIISNFEDLIAQFAVLAVFQSVVAGQGGNAASQSVAMFVRAIALGNVPQGKTTSLLLRQMTVGLFQGLAVGIVVGVGVTLWRGNWYLGLILGLALVGNLILAGIVGTLAPLGLKALGKDPALASSVLVTAVTDSLGFLIFLNLAKTFAEGLL